MYPGHLAIDEQKHHASDFSHQATNYISTFNAAKPDVLQKKNLLKDCSSVIQSILKKLKEMSLMNFNLVGNATCLVSLNII